jgi:hypothetical protein
MIFRAPFSRASRAAIILLMVAGLAVAIRAEIVTPYVSPATRFGWLVPTALMALVLLGGLQRLWVVCLIIDEDAGVIVRNFRGDIHFRRIEIKDVIRESDFSGFHVSLKLKTGDHLGLDGVTWMTPARTDRAVAEIRQALGFVDEETESLSA